MGLGIGINPITWTNDDMPELGGDIPLETCLAEARLAGYLGMELGNKFPRRAAVLKPILDRHGLRLVSGWYSAHLLERSVADEIAAIEGHLTLLADMGCGVMVFAEGSGAEEGRRDVPLSRRPVLPAGDWKSYGEAVTAVARHTAARGVQVAFHHHMGTVVETEAELDRLMQVTGPEVGLLLDTGHLRFAGGDPLAVARRHGARIVHVHCKDVRAPVMERARTRDASFCDAVLDGIFTVPGDGAIDFAPIVAVLKQHGYAGWLVVEAEQDPAKANPLQYARMGFANLSLICAAAGL